MLFHQDIKFLPGVGPKKSEILNKDLGIFTFGDLLYYFPYKYVDRTKFYTCKEINADMAYVQVIGTIRAVELSGTGAKSRLTAQFADSTGTIELIWFQGIKYVQDSLKPGARFVAFGKPTAFNGKVNIVHPELETPEADGKVVAGTIQAFYNTSERMKKSFLGSRAILKLQATLYPILHRELRETMPGWFVSKYRLMFLSEAVKQVHFPTGNDELRKARFRLKFEELFYIQLKLLSIKSIRTQKFKGHVFDVIGNYFNSFYHQVLPFELTDAQKRVVREIRHNVATGHQMNRLLQGDVGSGKTLVALMSMLIAVDNGTQACLMAPTEILATQHYATLKKMVDPLGLSIGLLTGSTKVRERRELHEGLTSGNLQLLVGTHALIEKKVEFKNLGLVVIDEQHRFGVAQRARLWAKNTLPPHVLVMTATPIPRTLAMTVYGDLDVSVIDELPPGRKPIKTVHFYDSKRKAVYQFLRDEIQKGRQIYIVYPLIEESEKLDLKSLQDGFETISKVFPGYKVCMVHGRMKPNEKEAEMQRFKAGDAEILVSTTVIEVGVDVPNASVMVIESAERFGLSQLHQLRGRVGRGADQSYCILMSSYKLSKESQIRLQTMVRTTDGFEIAETDMKLRGPGDIEGTQQSGLGFNLRIANLARDGEILQHARNIASDIIDHDPDLSQEQNNLFKEQLKKMKNNSFNWSSIS